MSYIGRLRTNTARFTDERVRLAGEAIAGCLAVKMMGEGFQGLGVIFVFHLRFITVFGFVAH